MNRGEIRFDSYMYFYSFEVKRLPKRGKCGKMDLSVFVMQMSFVNLHVGAVKKKVNKKVVR